MAEDFAKLSKIQFWKWKKQDEQWGTMLSELRTAMAMAQRQVGTKTARAKELMTLVNRDALTAHMAILKDLADLEATVTDAFMNAHKDDTDPEILDMITVEAEASKRFATTTKAIIKAATRVMKTVSEKIEERVDRDNRRDRRGQHTSDPPNKVSVASDIKPEKLCDSVNQLELDDWNDRAETFADASNILTQTNAVQLGYLQALVKPEMWQLFKEYCEANMILPSDINFERGPFSCRIPQPSLQETLDFVDNQVIVENMTQKSSAKKTDTVNNI